MIHLPLSPLGLKSKNHSIYSQLQGLWLGEFRRGSRINSVLLVFPVWLQLVGVGVMFVGGACLSICLHVFVCGCVCEVMHIHYSLSYPRL